MKIHESHAINRTLFCIMALCLGLLNEVSAEVEDTPVINSNEVLTSPYLSSTYHRVENIAFSNGYYLFNVESEYGHHEIISKALLQKRVNEIKILGQALNQFEQQNQQLSRELRSQISVSGNSAMEIITSPVSTANKVADQLRDKLGDTLTGESSYIDDYALRYSYSEPDDPTTATHKRNIAFQMQLDLYTNNYRVQSFLNSVANARSAGRVSAGVGLGNFIASSIKKSALDQQIRIILKNKSLDELNQYHRELLNELEVNSLLADAFMQQPFLSPGNRTVMLLYLKQLKTVENLPALIELVTSSDSEVMTMVFQRLCQALYFYFNRVEKFSAFRMVENMPAVVTDSKLIVLFEHRDLLIWNTDNSSQYKKLALKLKDELYKSWSLVSLGELTGLAKEELGKQGYKTQTGFLVGLSE